MRGRPCHRKSSRSGTLVEPCGKGSERLDPVCRCRCCWYCFCFWPLLLLSQGLLLLLPVFSLSRAHLFIPLSVAASLSSSTSSSSSLFLSFCPFSASANDSRLFIPRLCIARERASERGRFCVYSLLPVSPPLLCSIPTMPRPSALFARSNQRPGNINGEALCSRTPFRDAPSMRKAIPRLHHLSTPDRSLQIYICNDLSIKALMRKLLQIKYNTAFTYRRHKCTEVYKTYTKNIDLFKNVCMCFTK